MGTTDQQWTTARRVMHCAIRSSLHSSIASLNADGSSHVTPIGLVIADVDHDLGVTILAVDSGPGVWAKSLLRSQFVSAPGIRLVGTVGEQREST